MAQLQILTQRHVILIRVQLINSSYNSGSSKIVLLFDGRPLLSLTNVPLFSSGWA